MSWHTGTASTYKDLLTKLVAFCTENHVASVAVNAGGSSYVLNEVITVVGGTSTVVAKFVVTGVSGGAVTAVRFVNAGAYTVNPSATVTTTSSGSGTGCTLDLTYSSGGGWTAMRDTTATEKEVILRGDGTGSDEIFVGIKTYNVNDAYNWEVAGMTGYSSSVAWEFQPNISPGRADDLQRGSFVPLGNTSFDYWITVSPSRIMGVCKVGSAYPNFHIGFLDPFASDSEHPYPMWVCGSTDQYDLKFNETIVNYSGLTDPIGYSTVYPSGGVSFMRMPDGSWVNFLNSRFSSQAAHRSIIQTACVQPCGSQYGLETASTIDPSDEWYSNYLWTAVVPQTGNPGVPTLQIRPTPDDNGDRLLFPAQLVITAPTRAFVGQVHGLYWFHAAGTVTSEQSISIGGDVYRIFQNCNRSEDFTFFCIKEE